MIRLFAMIVLCVKSVVVFGIDQEKFCAIVKNYQSKSFGVSNELKLQKLRRNRKKDFSNSFNSKNFDWRGIIEEIDSVGSEYGYVSVRVCENTSIKTWNNELSELMSDFKTLIHIDSIIYDQLVELSEGDEIKCSGRFSSSKGDHFEETSMTDKGSLSEPEFLIRFTEFKKIN